MKLMKSVTAILGAAVCLSSTIALAGNNNSVRPQTLSISKSNSSGNDRGGDRDQNNKNRGGSSNYRDNDSHYSGDGNNGNHGYKSSDNHENCQKNNDNNYKNNGNCPGGGAASR